MHHISTSQGLSDTETLERMSQAGVHLMTNSWCIGFPSCGTSYNSSAVVWDAGVWDADGSTSGLQPLVVFFSAGNSSNGSSAGCGGGGDDVTTPATGKNVISVGASMANRSCGADGDRDFVLASFSSRGPVDPDGTGQGLFKPDVTQMGSEVVSVKSANAASSNACSTVSPPYRYFSGTSMSAPLTAGVGGAIYQDYVVNRGVAQPRPSLIKATLINGAFGITNPSCASDYTFETDRTSILQGWGYVDMARSLYGPSGGPQNRRILFENEDPANAVSTGETYQFDFIINSSADPLKFNLVWTDFPAAAAAGSPLVVNDLDLELVSPSGSVYYGNNFSGIWSVDTGLSAVRDRYNVVESVYVPTPEAGTWTARIIGFSVPQDQEPAKSGTNQNFSVVYSSDVAVCPQPEAPELSVDNVTTATVDLSWSNVPGVPGYNLYRSTTACHEDLSLVTSTGTTSHTDTGVVTGETYYYVVRSDDNGCESEDSNCEEVTLGARLVYEDNRICDGNRDGFVDPGETVMLPVTIFNDGDFDATNVSASLGTTTSGVTILDGTATFPDAPGRTFHESVTPHYAFEVDSSVPCGSAVDFSLDVAADQGAWPSTFQVMIGAVLPLVETVTQSADLVIGKNETLTSDFTPDLTIPVPATSVVLTPPALSGYSAGQTQDLVQIAVQSPSGALHVLKSCNQALQGTYDMTGFYSGADGGPGPWTLCVSTGEAEGCTGAACARQVGPWPDLAASGAQIEAEGASQTCTPNTGIGSCGPGEVPNVLDGEPPVRVSADSPETLTVEQDPEVTAYNVYTDAIGDFFGTPTKNCFITSWTDNGDGTVSFDAAIPDDSWVLVTGSGPDGESGAGSGSDGFERTNKGMWDRCGAAP
jgi:hypothetical protein